MSPALRRPSLLAALAILLTAPAWVACSADQEPPSGESAPLTQQSTQPSALPSIDAATPRAVTHARPTKTVQVLVYFVDDGGALVAEELPVDVPGDITEEALALAAGPSPTPGLHQAVPTGAFASASVDGFGRRGAFGVVLASRAIQEPAPGMSVAEAEAAVRAAVCTTQNGLDSPVRFYLHHEPVSRLFGQPITDGVVTDGRCPALR